ncbi:hypothetical protein B9Z55_028224 [Caenorhabditis nigoni]|uniref:Uncharacterized protein n=1 Tax=Caenorhabditis nigoni TaxID=1611254 RepID=A0A2G5SCR1_9PELO|nr:hypothetical protein B9Z55_028224 [Caenorhabditis nigoni]
MRRISRKRWNSRNPPKITWNMETAEAEWELGTTNTTNHSNGTNSTADRLADKKTVQTFGNKCGEALPIHKMSPRK